VSILVDVGTHYPPKFYLCRIATSFAVEKVNSLCTGVVGFAYSKTSKIILYKLVRDKAKINVQFF